MSSKIKVDTIENVAGSGNVSLGSGHNLVVPGTLAITGASTLTGATTIGGDLTVDTSTLKVDASNNRVGVGTTSPDGALHVKGMSDHGRLIIEHGGTSGSTNHNFISFHNHGGNTVAEIQSEENATNESALIFKTGGTTTAMTIDKDGQVTKPLQPYFNAKRDSAVQLTAGTYQDIAFASEYKDVGSNFDGTTFTAPVTGVYSFSVGIRLDNADTDVSYYNFWLNTSNRSYHQLRDMRLSQDSIFIFAMNVIADMDANDTAKFQINQQGGTNQTNVNNSTNFFGYLLG